MEIQSIKIEGLLGKNYKIPIKENKLIIVAENGSGKTTILRLIYFFLTKQWEKLSECGINEMCITINNNEFRFSAHEFKDIHIDNNVYEDLAKIYPSYSSFIINEFSNYKISELRSKPYLIDDLEQKYDVPKGLIISLINDVVDQFFDNTVYNWTANIIYLPTYRRIEKDYSVLFGDLDKRVSNYIKNLFPEIKEKIETETRANEFGYSETEDDINDIFSSIINSRNNEKWLKKTAIENFEMIEFGMADVNFKVNDHYKLKDDLYLVDRFCSLANKYFKGKKTINFDKNAGEMYVEQLGQKYSLTYLSSGEKQLVSIFCHLFFDKSHPFIIIDEPEISLSLSWQEMLLNDITSIDCNGMIIATHSPFIVSDNLKQFTHGINEFDSSEY